jgi:hypothetical protein
VTPNRWAASSTIKNSLPITAGCDDNTAIRCWFVVLILPISVSKILVLPVQLQNVDQADPISLIERPWRKPSTLLQASRVRFGRA